MNLNNFVRKFTITGKKITKNFLLEHSNIIELRVLLKINGLKSNNNYMGFGKNKTYIYSDFDRTISPAGTKDIFYGTNKEILKSAKSNFELLNKILDKYNDVVLIITTGRADVELRRMYELYKKQGIDFVNAHSVITKDGADGFIRDEKITDDYPFVKQNKARSQKLSNSANWHKKEILKDTLEIIKQNNLHPVKCDTTLSPITYGEYTIFSHPEKIDSKTVFVRNLGEFKLYLGFPDEIPEETYTKLKNEISDYLSNKGINFSLVEKEQDYECAKLRSLTFLPIIDNHPLTKRYDINECFKNLDDTDVIIVAGDSHNDKEMLNPLSYTEKIDKTFPISGFVIKKENEPEPTLEKLLKDYGEGSKTRCLKEIPEGSFAEEIEKFVKKRYPSG